MPSIIDTVSTQIEQVSRNIPYLSEATNTNLSREWKKTEKAERISNYLLRIPLQLYRGGTAAKLSGHNGVLPAGTSSNYVHLIAGYIGWVRTHGLTRDQLETSQSSEQSRVNYLAEQLSAIIQEAQQDEDVELHTSGNGVLTNAASTGTATTLVFAAATDRLGTKLVRPGMMVDVYDTTLATLRANGPYKIQAVNRRTKTVTFSSAPTAMGTTDRIVIHNVASFGPATPTTDSATWPARGTAAGLGGDSYRHGIPYAHSITTTNYLQLTRAAVPELNPNYVDAAGAGLEFNFLFRLKAECVARRGEDPSQWFGVAHQAQQQQYFDLGVAIVNKQITGDSVGKSIDLLPSDHKYTDVFEAAGVPFIVDKRQQLNRIDLINRAQIGRAYLYNLRPYRLTPGGPTMWEGIDATTGRRTTTVEFGMESSFDYVFFDPGSGGLIENLAVPTGDWE